MIKKTDADIGIDNLITKKALAEALHVHPKTIDRWCREGLLERIKIPNTRTVRFRQSEVQRLIHNSRQGATVSTPRLSKKAVGL